MKTFFTAMDAQDQSISLMFGSIIARNVKLISVRNAKEQYSVRQTRMQDISGNLIMMNQTKKNKLKSRKIDQEYIRKL
tara:strand:+ start:419 stop:652 length:234 start_codon:yes stop_codon:yes gene_type:complete